MKHHPVLPNLFLLVMLLVTPLLSTCAVPTPPPTVATEPATATPAEELHSTSVALPQPTEVPTPVALPPTVISVSPARGEPHPPDAPLMVTFDQPLDEPSAAAAFGIEPEAEGQVTVEGDTLLFTPDEPLERATRYQITIAETAKSALGLALGAPLSFAFNTVGYLEVTSTQPPDGAEEVATDILVTAVFNRPVVPLMSLDEAADLPQPLEFDPLLEGTGEWLNTSIYVFQPSAGFAAATSYAVTVRAGLTDVSGGLLAEDYTWSFVTAAPVVVYQEPTRDQAPPTSAITVTFSQPMDRGSSQAAFSLLPEVEGEPHSANPIEGRFQWADDDRTLVFQPDEWLEFGASYYAEVDDTAQPAVGEGGLRRDESWSFAVVPLPGIASTEPEDGAEDVDPYGGMEIYFASPLDEETLAGAVTVLPEPTGVYSYYNSWNSRLWISWDWEPQTAYTVTLASTIGDSYGNTLGDDVVVRFATGDYEPTAFLDVMGEMGTYNAYTDTLISATYRNVSRLDFALYRLDEETFMSLTGEEGWRFSREFDPSRDTKGTKEGMLLRQWSEESDALPNESGQLITPLTGEDGDPLLPGIYYLVMAAPEIEYEEYRRPPHAMLILSAYNLILKSTVGEALLWATDLKTGQPVEGLPVRLLDEKGLAERGDTDEEGLFGAEYDERDSWRPLYAFVGEQGAENYGVVMSRWSNGVSPWDFQLRGETYREPYSGNFYTERPIYRPGQTVHWKGIIRTDDDARYGLPPQTVPISVTIRDSMGTEVYQAEHDLSDMGTLHGDLELDEEAGLGGYWLEAVLDEQRFGTSFQVAEYRKPEYEVSVQTDQPEYIQGDTISATVQASYFFGGPVKEAAVRWAVLSQDTSLQWKGKGWYNFSDWDWGDWRRSDQWTRFGELLAEGQGQTEADGSFSFSVPADIAQYKRSQAFTFDVIITDVNGQEVASRAAVVVHKGEFYIGVSPRRYVGRVGERQEVDLITVDPQSEPVPEVELTVVAAQYKWYSVQEKGDDGRFYWTSKAEVTPIVTKTLTTDADGKALFEWTPPEAGEYKIIASGEDDRGNEVLSSAFMWISGKDFISWRRENNDRIDLIADKREYEPGDVAEILVPHPFQGEVEALLTIERGHIYEARRLTLTTNSETIEVPITAEHIPNIFISVVIVKGMDEADPHGSFKVGYIELPVSTAEKELEVTIVPSSERVGPRDTVTYTVEAKDHAGQPVEAEFSLALVDKAVLALADASGPSLLNHFYRQRGVGVGTAATMVTNLNRVVQEAVMEADRGAKGGGGGGQGDAPSVRREFPDIAYWNPVVQTDAEGKAVVSVPLPDNLTTWRMTGRGLTVATEVGEAQSDVVATKDLLVRAVAPRFFVVGDQADLAAVVHNNTDEDEEVEVSLEAVGLDVKGPAIHQVTVPAQGLVKVSWPVAALPGDQVVALWTALGERHDDAMELTLPVYRYSTPEVVGTSGQVLAGESRLEAIRLPVVIDASQGDLSIKLEPSLAAGMVEGLKYLEHYPWECVEQTMSRFLPNVLTYRALQDLGIERPDLQTKTAQLVGVGLQRIYNQQKMDGGWGWWAADESRPFLTAYVLFGLFHADEAGFLVDEDVMDRASRYLKRQLHDPDDLIEWQLNQQAFLLFVLAEVGEPDVGRTVALFDYREKLAHYGKGYLAMALGLVEEEGERGRVDSLLSDLVGEAILSATGAHWEEGTVDWWTMNTDTRSTSVVLDAFARLAPKDTKGTKGGEALAPNVVRWLMVARKAGRWETTQETAWALIALTDWMAASGELEADYSWEVRLNGELLGEGTATQDNVDEAVELKADIAQLFLDRANALLLERLEPQAGQTGEGRLYYTAHLRYFLPVEELEPLDRGVVVARRYEMADCEDTKGTKGEDTKGTKGGEDCPPVSQAQVGDVIRVKLTLVAPNDLHYLVVEDPLPAGCEAVDISLKTVSALYEGPDMDVIEREPEAPWWWNLWLPTHSELRDEKVGLFATWLRRGTYEYTYLMRASLPGRFLTLPSTAYEMYFPEVWGRGAGGAFTVTE